ncbi:MAG: signal transduction histidine kinase [Paraglaciecola sp.]|jgi:signal transduction histidine kinase
MFNYTETHDLLISLIGNAPYGILTTDLNGYVSIVNKQFLKNFHLTDDLNEVLETSVLAYLGGIPKLLKLVKSCLGAEDAPFDLLAVAYKGKYLNIRGRNFLKGIILTTEDVTTAKEMESFQSMLDGQEAERKRLASEIHDGVGAMLSTLTMSLESMRPQIEQEIPELLEKHEYSMKLAKSINQDLRNISHALMPSTLIDFGLTQAIKMLCDTIDKSGTFKTNFYHKGLEKRLPQNVELALYRITQEIVNNAIKYSKAENLTIQLIRYPKSILLMTEDDGMGFDKAAVEKDKTKGIGLRNIQIRTKSIGGSFNMDSQPGRGVSMTIDVPLT